MNKYDLDTPVAIVDLDTLERNIKDISDFVRNVGVNLRPHIKTHKIPEIAAMQLEAGAIGITCAKLGEAEVMADHIDDVDIFIANPLVGKEKMRRLLELAERPNVKKLSVGLDSVEIGQPISDAAQQRGLKIPVLIKIDVGNKRLGVAPGLPAVELAQKLEKMPGLDIAGIYTHEGHVAEATRFENLRDIALQAGQDMVETAVMLRKSGIEVKTVSVGSTPSAKITCTVPGITESRPGTYVFYDYGLMRQGVIKEKDCAFTVLSTIVSIPSPDRALIDAGSKCLTSEMAAEFGVYGYIKQMPHVPLFRANEEVSLLRLDPSKDRLKIGDKLEIIPNHICPSVNLFDEVVAVRNDRVETTWKVAARGKVR